MSIGFNCEPSELMNAVEIAVRNAANTACLEITGVTLGPKLEHVIVRAIRAGIETYAKGQYNMDDLERDLNLKEGN